MALTADELIVKIRGDLSDINKKLKTLENNVTTSTQKAGKAFTKMSNLAKVAIGSVVAIQIGRLGSKIIALTSNADEMESKFNVVFGSFATQVKDNLIEFGDAVGRSTTELQTMAASVQDTFVPMGLTREEASKLSVELTKLAVDVGSFNDISDPEVMKAFQSALVGNHETVRRFGVVIDEAKIQQELFAMGIKENVRNVSAATKIQARYNIIVKGTADANGDAQRTANSFANQNKRLRAELSELAIGIGKKLLGPLSSFLRVMANIVVKAKEFLIEMNLINAIESAERIAQLEEETAKLTETLKNQLNSRRNLSKEERDYSQGNYEQTEILKENQKAFSETTKALVEKRAELNKLKNIQAGVNTELEKTNELEAAQLGAKQKLEDEIEKVKKKNEIYKEGLKTLNEAQVESALSTLNFQKEITLLGDKTGDLEIKLMNANLALFENKKAYEEAMKKAKELADAQSNLEKINEAFVSIADTVASTVEQSFLETIAGTKSALESFKDFSRTLVEEIIRTYLRMAVINPILNEIFKPMTGKGFTPRDTITPGEFLNNVTNLGKRTVSAVSGAAGGGTIQGKQPIMVGERGPEMFVPNTGGRIIPNGALPSGGRSTVINQSLNFSTGIQNTVRAEVMNMMPIIQNATLQAVVDQKRRGGAFAQGMG